MSRIRANRITSNVGGAPEFENGVYVSGIATVTNRLDVQGNMNVDGVITYDDVTNVDSIGIITARTGVRVLNGDFLMVGSASSLGIATDKPLVSVDASRATDAFALPQGTTEQRPNGEGPFLRFNTTNSALEYYNGTDWVEIITDYFPTGSVILG